LAPNTKFSYPLVKKFDTRMMNYGTKMIPRHRTIPIGISKYTNIRF